MYSASVTHDRRGWLRGLFGRRPDAQPVVISAMAMQVLDWAAENTATVYEDAETRWSYAVDRRGVSVDVSREVDRLEAAGWIVRDNLYGATGKQRRNWKVTDQGSLILAATGRPGKAVAVEADVS